MMLVRQYGCVIQTFRKKNGEEENLLKELHSCVHTDKSVDGTRWIFSDILTKANYILVM
jgi:hypothetical protein